MAWSNAKKPRSVCWTAWSKEATLFGKGLRVSNGRIYQLEEHLARLQASAHALMFDGIPELGSVRKAVFDTLEANGMSDGVHIRLTLTRGENRRQA